MRRENFKLSIIILLIVVISLSATYAYLELKNANNATISQGGCFAVNYTGQTINNSSLKSTTDYTQGASSNIVLSKNANCEIYTKASIYLHTNSSETDAPLSNGAMKYKIMQGTTEVTSGVISAVTESTEDQLLTTVDLTTTATTYTVYLWIDSEISQGTYHEKTYSGYLYASSSQTSTITGVNPPNLDSGNLIPVYFDETEGTYGSWMKADSTNKNNSWYDYNNKMWANAVIVDPSKKSTYQGANVGTKITDADIIAFYVWIPRYKYRVWNLNRQGTSETGSGTTVYAYPAYSNGIEIQWEIDTSSTGNVQCTYNIKSAENASNLSDTCVYNDTDTITTTSLNTNYTDAWYTHPAFTFGDGTDKEKTGFWIGKFETGNTADVPKVLPNISSLRSQNVSNQFMTAVKFQSYLSSAVDAHMLTNLEWGAVAYLTHSNYGLCNGTSCKGLYINNSYGTSCYFTGRSGGAIAGSTDLSLDNVYGTGGTTQYNCNGYYDYKGYKLDYNTGEPTTKDINKVASTTGNITGVYDVSGGAHEYVMGNMVTSSYAFSSISAGNYWNSSSWYDTTNSALYSKYYNAYSFGTSNSDILAYNRARLGDATAEVLGSSTSTSGSWKIGSGKTGSYSYFVDSTHSWFSRGGSSNNTSAGPFFFSANFGSSSSYYSFRSSLS